MCLLCVHLGTALALTHPDAALPCCDADGEPYDVPFSPGADGATCVWAGLPCGAEDTQAAAFLAAPLGALGHTLAPVRVDGAGSCLFCAASRALVGSEVLAATLRRRCHAELAAHADAYAALPLGDSGVTLGSADVDEALAALAPSWALQLPAASDVAVLALATVLRRPVVRLSSPSYPHATLATFLPLRAGGRRRPLLLAWAYVRGAATPEHYVALQRRGDRPGRLALPPALRPHTWPQHAPADASCIDWDDVAPLPPAQPPAAAPPEPLSAAGFASGAAYATLLDALAHAARAELQRLASDGALAAVARAPPGEATVATDTLLRLFYSACGLETAMAPGMEGTPLPGPEAINAALESPGGGVAGAAVAEATCEVLSAAGLGDYAAALGARLWRLGHERHVYLAACACAPGWEDAAALRGHRAAQAAALAAAGVYDSMVPPAAAAAAQDAWQARTRDVALVVSRLGRTDSGGGSAAAAPPPPAAAAPPAAATPAPCQPLAPSPSLAAAQTAPHPAQRMAAARASRLLRARCAAAGVPNVDALTDDAVEDVVLALCLATAGEAAEGADAADAAAAALVTEVLRSHGY